MLRFDLPWRVCGLALLVLAACGDDAEPAATADHGSDAGADAVVEAALQDGPSGDAAAETTAPAPDKDGDKVPDGIDNCPDDTNPLQEDTDKDGEGDACELQDGTWEHPFIIPGDPALPDYHDGRDTTKAPSDDVDVYPGHETIDESGPEYVYMFRLEHKTEVRAAIGIEPGNTDVDVHLLSSASPPVVVQRADRKVAATLDPGLYYLSLDSCGESGAPLPGPYTLAVSLLQWHAGTIADPWLPGESATAPLTLPFAMTDDRDTTTAASDAIDTYPGHETLDESGPEIVYTFAIGEPARLSAFIDYTEPDGTDIDLHLLSSIDPPVLIDRGNRSVYSTLEPGPYWLVMDTFVAGGVPQAGPYHLSLSIRSRKPAQSDRFDD